MEEGRDTPDAADDSGTTPTLASGWARPGLAGLGFLRRRSWGVWRVRLVALAGIVLIILSATGGWLTNTLFSSSGFGDVVSETLQRQAVRDYIADQATLHFADTNKLVTQSRPIVTDVVAEALKDPAITSAVRSFAMMVHDQVLASHDTLRSNAAASSAALSIRTTLQSIDPALARKLPSGVLNATSKLSQNRWLDYALTAGAWIRWLYLPIGLLGVGLVALALRKAQEPARAVRATGFTLAIVGMVPVGLGAATPYFAVLGRSVDPGRGAAVAAFVDVLLGGLVRAGWVLAVLGVLLVFLPGRDGAGLRVRLGRTLVWGRSAARTPGWQLAGAALALAAAAGLVLAPGELFGWLALAAGIGLVFVALVILSRVLGLVVADQVVARLRRRQLAGGVAGMLVCASLTTLATGAVVSAANHPHRANPVSNGCNGSIELCAERLNQIVWPGSHNAMSSTAYNFLSAEHTLTIPEQLNQGARALLIDAYYGYQRGGLVRTNLAGGRTTAEITAEFGADAARELQRVGALTGAADTSGAKQDVYLCHDLCEMGAVKASDVFSQINDYLDRNLTDVLILDVEDYVGPADLEAALKKGHLWDRVYTPDLTRPLPTLLEMISPPAGQDQAQRRVIITSERHAGQAPWLVGTYQLMQETPYTFKSVNDFNCQPNRGSATNPLLLVNHWLRTGSPPDPVLATKVNSSAQLTRRLGQCITERRVLPNIVAVDFFGLGDTTKVVDQYNAAIAEVTGTADFWTKVATGVETDPSYTQDDVTLIEQTRRLPPISLPDAEKLLGPLTDTLTPPNLVVELATLDRLGELSTPIKAPR